MWEWRKKGRARAALGHQVRMPGRQVVTVTETLQEEMLQRNATEMNPTVRSVRRHLKRKGP